MVIVNSPNNGRRIIGELESNEIGIAVKRFFYLSKALKLRQLASHGSQQDICISGINRQQVAHALHPQVSQILNVPLHLAKYLL